MSAHLPAHGYPTPSASPHKKMRRLLRDSEETDGEMSIESYLYRCDPCRSTSLQNPLPYPLRLADDFDLQTRMIPLLEQIEKVLEEYRPEFPGTLFAIPQIGTKPRYPGGDVPVKYLRVTHYNGRSASQAGDVRPQGFGRLEDAICQILSGSPHKIEDMVVDVVDIDNHFRPSLFPIQPDHPLVQIFKAAKGNIIKLLGTHLGTNWRFLCPFNVGRNQRKAVPTIVVVVDPLTSTNWSHLIALIQYEILQIDSSAPVSEVEFLPGDMSFLTDAIALEERIDPNGVPDMGCSIGIRGERNAGTMSGFVTLTVGGKTHQGILTNYHVVRPSNPAGSNRFLKLDQFGSSKGALTDIPIQMEFPASADTDAALKRINSRMKVVEDATNEHRAYVEESKIIGKQPQGWRSNAIQTGEGTLTKLRAKRDLLKTMPRLLGDVRYTSGLAVLGRRVCDWAFVEIPTSESHLFHQNTMPDVPGNQAPWQYDTRYGTLCESGTVLQDFGNLELGGYYLKYGRSSGLTAGICNGAHACCNWGQRDRICYDHNGKTVQASNITEEYVFMNKKHHELVSEQSTFAEHGDSGSFILDRYGRICGLLYGGITSYVGPPGGETQYYASGGLAMDMPDLVKSIQLKTAKRDDNGHLVEPLAGLGLP